MKIQNWEDYDELEEKLAIKEARNKTHDKWRNYARELGRAQVGFSSDPMDYAALKGYNFWWKSLYDAHIRLLKSISKKTDGKDKEKHKKDIEYLINYDIKNYLKRQKYITKLWKNKGVNWE